MENYQGYLTTFISEELAVPLPVIKCSVPTDQSQVFEYTHFSVVMSWIRRFPYYTATNINGRAFRQLNRKDNWREDVRYGPRWQWGSALYNVQDSDFDKGHMTKREDPQWGSSDAIASKAADETFYYTNAVPQMKSLNRSLRAWRGLEEYILHNEARLNKGAEATANNPGLKISVFTGPVLHIADPRFARTIAGRHVQLPILFWKVVYYTNDGQELRRVGFMMGQHQAMQEAGVLEAVVEKFGQFNRNSLVEEYFEDYRDAEPYLTGVRHIEEQTGLTFPLALELNPDKKPDLLLYHIPAIKSMLLEHTEFPIQFSNLQL